jgi:hypothetical protein
VTPEQKSKEIYTDVLRETLVKIDKHDKDYGVRYGLVLHALHLAHELGMPAGVRIDPGEPEWPVVYIELPTGQVSWHMPEHPIDFDGHDSAMKSQRVLNWAHRTD